MKKIFKVLIALVIIAGIAVGAYFLFFHNKTNNLEIHTKVTALNKQENYVNVNDTLTDMVQDIVNSSYDLPEIQTYFTVYTNTVKNYEIIRDEILEFGLFANNNNTGNSYKQLEKEYENLTSVYQKASNYLKNTYWKSPSKPAIENFYYLFKNALSNLNGFYYNAGMAYLISADNSIQTNNHYKLEIEYCLYLNNAYVNNYLETKEEQTAIFALINAEKQQLNILSFNDYINQKETYDKLYTNPGFNKKDIVEKYLAEELDAYFQTIKNEQTKLLINNYCDLVVRG